VQPEGLSKSGNEPAPFRLVAQCRNHLRHREPTRKIMAAIYGPSKHKICMTERFNPGAWLPHCCHYKFNNFYKRVGTAMGTSDMPKERSTQNTTHLTCSVPGANRLSHPQSTEVTPDMETSTGYSLFYRVVCTRNVEQRVRKIRAIYRISRRVISTF